MSLKKGSFRMLHRNWWRWCRAKKIRRNNLLVLAILESGPWGAGQYTGLFNISVDDIMDYTGLTETDVLYAFAALERIGAIVYDKRKQVVFVSGMLARQSPSFASSKNNLLGISNHVERMPEGSPAVRAFIEAQRNIPELFELLEGYLEGDSEGEAEGDSEGDFEQTLDLRPEDLDTGDLRPEDRETGDKETVSALNNRASTLASPTSSPTDSKGNGAGKEKAEDRLVAWTDTLSLLKQESLRHALALVHQGDQGAAEAHLKAAGFTKPEFVRACELLGEVTG